MINNILAQFKSKEMEERYRSHTLRSDVHNSSIGIGLFLISTTIFLVYDYSLIIKGHSFYYLMIIRSIFYLYSLSILAIFMIIRNFRHFDMFMFVWVFLLGTLVVAGKIYRFETGLQHTYINILFVIIIYVYFSSRLLLQFIPSFIFSVVNICLLFSSGKSSGEITVWLAIASYIIGNVIGVIICWRYHVTRRKLFANWKEELKLREELEEALANNKTLRDLLPICSSCKKVRNDLGYWEQIDHYISKHAGTQFSHGLCEECQKKLYGNEKWFKG